MVRRQEPGSLTAPAHFKVGEAKKKMTHHIGYIHGSKLEPFSPPSFCQSGAGLEEYTYYYHKGYRQVTGKPYYSSYYSASEQGSLLRAAA